MAFTIGIAGVGAVGGALKKWLETHTKHNIKIYDPPKGHSEPLTDCVATFICVPVPTLHDGTQDYSMLEDAIKNSCGTKFIRSTVLPGTNNKYGTFSCPEFLTERSAFEDTCKMDILTGHWDNEFLSEIFPGKEIITMTNIEAEIAKYAHNGFGALKVNYFNIVHELCRKMSARYARVLAGVLMSGYINETHTKVPGPDGKHGFGGTCFPKDLRALQGFFPKASFAACLYENEIYRDIGS
jgi:UDP-glucose 6-dehydrogenase